MTADSVKRHLWPLKLFVAIVGTFIAYYALGALIFGTDKLRLNDECEVAGVLGRFEEALLGRRFWKYQVEALQDEYKKAVSLSIERTRAEQQAIKGKQLVATLAESLYAERPELRPTPSQRYADHLREQADEIEESEQKRQFEFLLQHRLAVLTTCLHVATINAHQQ
jgi:hypothetical protein